MPGELRRLGVQSPGGFGLANEAVSIKAYSCIMLSTATGWCTGGDCGHEKGSIGGFGQPARVGDEKVDGGGWGGYGKVRAVRVGWCLWILYGADCEAPTLGGRWVGA